MIFKLYIDLHSAHDNLAIINVQLWIFNNKVIDRELHMAVAQGYTFTNENKEELK